MSAPRPPDDSFFMSFADSILGSRNPHLSETKRKEAALQLYETIRKVAPSLDGEAFEQFARSFVFTLGFREGEPPPTQQQLEQTGRDWLRLSLPRCPDEKKAEIERACDQIQTVMDQATPEQPKTVVQECGFCHKASQTLKKCSRCLKAMYCSREHQKSDWPYHKKVCVQHVRSDQ